MLCPLGSKSAGSLRRHCYLRQRCLVCYGFYIINVLHRLSAVGHYVVKAELWDHDFYVYPVFSAEQNATTAADGDDDA